MAASVASRLQIRAGQSVRVVNAPPDLDLDVPTTRSRAADAVLVFALNRAELEQHATEAVELALEDRLTWIAYPKAGQLGTDLDRNVLRNLLEGRGIRPVRQIALDDVWSALRFRPA